MKTKIFTSVLIIALLTSSNIYADTFGKVVEILNQSCGLSSSCHNSEGKIADLDLSGDREQIYNAIVNKAPVNEIAKAKNHSLVTPGDPSKSFLYRKMNYDLHNDSKLTEGENQLMPVGYKIKDESIELIRQWILYGAKNDTKEYVNYATLKEYYENPSAQLPQIEAPPAPAPGEGYQIQLGPIFLEPSKEVEYVYRYELRNEEEEEVNRIDVQMNKQSHHFLFFKFNEGEENKQEPGLLPVKGRFDSEMAITPDTKMIGGWAYPKNIELPKGTAYKWSEDAVLKLNYHILNYSSTAILPAKLYVNIYTQPAGTAIKEMHSEFHISLEQSFDIGRVFKPGISEHSWHMNNFYEARSNEEVHIWTLGSHTHKYGVDFDMYLNENRIMGDQIYEGHYNLDYTVNQGEYSYEEPPFRYFNDFLTINSGDGLRIEGVYDNTSDRTVNFGLTTNDEMFGMFVQYLTGDISEVRDLVSIKESDTSFDWAMHPNPTKGSINIELPVNVSGEKSIRIIDVLGKEVLSEQISSTQSNLKLNLSNQSPGYYLVKLNTTEGISVRKLLLN